MRKYTNVLDMQLLIKLFVDAPGSYKQIVVKVGSFCVYMYVVTHLTAKGTFCSPTADNKAEKCISQSTR